MSKIMKLRSFAMKQYQEIYIQQVQVVNLYIDIKYWLWSSRTIAQ
jgi:hypothetical protein